MAEEIKARLKLLLGRGVFKSYSQFGEDAFLNALFRHHRNGFYVDVGAYHPTLYSNTYALYRRGWHGIVIDANPSLERLFAKLRPRDRFLRAAVGKGALRYRRYSDGAYNTLDDTYAAKLARAGKIPLTEETLDARPLHELLAAADAPAQIDLLNIDLEGMDLMALESNDWSRFPPRVVAVEAHDFDPESPTINACYVFLREHNYRLKGLAGPTLIFVKS